MRELKKQYQKPEVTDQGSVVNKTRATSCGYCWDGNPTSGNDNQKPCSDEESEASS
jgi:hypothetical protein